MTDKTVVLGYGVTGRAVVSALASRQEKVRIVDENPTQDLEEVAQETGVEVVDVAKGFSWREVLEDCSQIVLSPGIRDDHPIFESASDIDIPILDEFDLASRWDKRPCSAITGTNGKTTVVTLVAEILNQAGIKAEVAGNTDIPLVKAIDDPDIERFVLESSSFRLAHSLNFSASPATWLNFAPDHLDIHRNLDSYEQAKSKIWDGIFKDEDAIANLSDPVVARHAPEGCTSFGTTSSTCRVQEGFLLFREEKVIALDDVCRKFPHDLENAQAAVATAIRSGATLEACAEVLANFSGLPHRMEDLGFVKGIRFINDSKATTPHATISSMRAVSEVTLILGGQNKGLDFADFGVLKPKRVIAIGETADAINEVFQNICPVQTAKNMQEAVEQSVVMTRSGGTVLLSPGCSSFDWYNSYKERGDEFRSLVMEYGRKAKDE